MAAGTGAGVKVGGGAGENSTPPFRSLSPFLLFSRARLAGASLLVVAVGATAGSGYLPVVGPPPLRFQLPPVLVTNQVILPPLAVIEPPPPETNAAGAIPALIAGDPANQAPTGPLLDPLALPPPVIGPFAAGTTNVIIVTPSEPEGISPQMFMRYFTGRPGTNSAGVAIIPPIGFIPPVPIVPPSSSATFQTTPPGKP